MAAGRSRPACFESLRGARGGLVARRLPDLLGEDLLRALRRLGALCHEALLSFAENGPQVAGRSRAWSSGQSPGADASTSPVSGQIGPDGPARSPTVPPASVTITSPAAPSHAWSPGPQ